MAGTKRDYYEVLGVAQGRRRRRRSSRPTASWPCSITPTATSATRRRRPSSRRPPRPTRSCATRRSATRYDRYGHAGLKAWPSPGFGEPTSFVDIVGDLFGTFSAAAGGGRRAARSAAATCGWPSRSTWSRRPRASRSRSRSARQEVCLECCRHRQQEQQAARRAAAARAAAGRPAAGLLPAPAELPGLQRGRHGHRRPVCQPAAATAASQVERTHRGHRPAGRGHGLRLLRRRRGRGRRPGAPRGDLTASSASRSTRCSSARARTCSSTGADHLQPGGPGGDSRCRR